MLGLLGAALAQAPPPVVGGSKTSDWTGVGALVAVRGDLGKVFCSGTLLSGDRVLTAAHCVMGMAEYEADGDEIWFFQGADVFQSGSVDDAVPVAAAWIHPDYDAVTLDHDVAVLELAASLDGEPMALNERTMGSSWVGRDLWHVGFGLTGYEADDGGTKREVLLPVYQVLGGSIIHYDPGGDNICQGDSGGPVIDPNDDTIVGVASYVWISEDGDAFCETGGAGSARVDVDADWITETAELDGSTDTGTGDEGTDGDPSSAEPTTGAAGQLPDDERGLSCATGAGIPGRVAFLWVLAGLFVRRRVE